MDSSSTLVDIIEAYHNYFQAHQKTVRKTSEGYERPRRWDSVRGRYTHWDVGPNPPPRAS